MKKITLFVKFKEDNSIDYVSDTVLISKDDSDRVYIVDGQAEALKEIPAPEEKTVEVQNNQEEEQYLEETRIEVKPSLWQRFKQSKFVQTIKYVMKIRIVLDVPALPSGDENKKTRA